MLSLMKLVSYLLISFVMFGAFTACKSKDPILNLKPDNRKTAQLLNELNDNRFAPEFLSAKASVKFKRDEATNSFKANIRMQKDSIIWMSISAVGYEAARLMLTPDSIFLMNRTERNYYKGNLDYISEKLDINLSFQMVQNLLLGNAVGLDSLDNIKRSNAKDSYLLSSLNKRKVKQLKQKPEKFDQNEVFYNNWIQPDYLRVVKISIFDLRTDQSALFKYSDYKPIEQQQVAHQINIAIQAAQTAALDIDFSRISIEDELTFSFRIPSKYERIEQ